MKFRKFLAAACAATVALSSFSLSAFAASNETAATAEESTVGKWVNAGSGVFKYTSAAKGGDSSTDDWNAVAPGSVKMDLAELLPEGKTLKDIRKISATLTVTGGGTGGSMGVSTVTDADPYYEWSQSGFSDGAAEIDCPLGVCDGNQLQLQLDWINYSTEATITVSLTIDGVEEPDPTKPEDPDKPDTTEAVKIELASGTSTGAALDGADGSTGTPISVPIAGVDGKAVRKVVVEFDADKTTTNYFNGQIGANETAEGGWYQSATQAYPESQTWTWECAKGVGGDIMIQFNWINKVQDDTNTPGTAAIKSVTLYGEKDVVLVVATPKADSGKPDDDDKPTDGAFKGEATISNSTAYEGWYEVVLTSIKDLIGDLDQAKTTITFTSSSAFKIGYNSVKNGGYYGQENETTYTVAASDIASDDSFYFHFGSGTKDQKVTWTASDGSSTDKPGTSDDKPAGPGTVGSVTFPSDDKPSTPSESKDDVKFENTDTKVEVSAPKDAFEKPEEVTFNAAPVPEETKDGKFTFDLSFTDKDGKAVQPKVAVTVKIPVPEALKGKTVYVYHIEADGKYTEVSCKVEDGMVVFSASSFSKYVVSETKLNASGAPADDVSGNSGSSNTPDTPTNPNTGVAALSLLPVAAAIAGVVISKKRK